MGAQICVWCVHMRSLIALEHQYHLSLVTDMSDGITIAKPTLKMKQYVLGSFLVLIQNCQSETGNKSLLSS